MMPAESGPLASQGEAIVSDGAAVFRDDVFCPRCGYNLRGLTGERCPECGDAIDRKALVVSAIPWANRVNRGVLRAYWQTVWFAFSHSDQLAYEIARPVSYTDAQRFRWMTVAHVWGPVALCAAIGCVLATTVGFPSGALQGFFAMIWPPIAGLVGFLAAVIVGTGLHTYFFHPHSLSIERDIEKPPGRASHKINTHPRIPPAPRMVLLGAYDRAAEPGGGPELLRLRPGRAAGDRVADRIRGNPS